MNFYDQHAGTRWKHDACLNRLEVWGCILMTLDLLPLLVAFLEVC
jgi:hypothetical protein